MDPDNYQTQSSDYEKPPYSCAKLIGQALCRSSNGELSGREIVKWLSETYPYYRLTKRSDLLNRVNGSLSSYRYFELKNKCRHRWCIAPEYVDVMKKTAFIPQGIDESGKLVSVNLENEADELYESENDGQKRPSQNERPPFSYAKLIGQALYHSADGLLSPKEIGTWISETYPYYRSKKKHVIDRVSSSLSSYRFYDLKNKCTHHWCIAPEYVDIIRKTAFIPQTFDEATGKLISVNLEFEAEEVSEAENSGASLPWDETLMDIVEKSLMPIPEITMQEPSNENETLMDIVEKSLMPIPEITMQEPSNDTTVIPNNAPETNSSANPSKNEEDATVVDKKPSINSLRERLKTLEPPRELDANTIDLTLDDDSDTEMCDVKFVPPQSTPTISLLESDESDAEIDTKVGIIRKPDLKCPICDEGFFSMEKLGRHVITHSKISTPSGLDITPVSMTSASMIPAHITRPVSVTPPVSTTPLSTIPSVDVTPVSITPPIGMNPAVDMTRLKEMLQNVASSALGDDKGTPICVFTGNLYLSRENL